MGDPRVRGVSKLERCRQEILSYSESEAVFVVSPTVSSALCTFRDQRATSGHLQNQNLPERIGREAMQRHLCSR